MPAAPDWDKVSVVVLMNVATRAHMMAVAQPSRAARRAGEPRMPSSVSMAAQPRVTVQAVTQARLSGKGFPPCGSDVARKTVKDMHVTTAAHQVTGRITWWSQARRSTRANTSSVTSSGWTTDSCPAFKASAWKTKAPASAIQPNSHSGFLTR
jgi:hypothetical protein